MELGNILGKFKSVEKEVPKKFLALVLTDEVVQAAVWHVQNEQTEITALGIPVEWDGDTATTAELVSAADATISNAMEGITQEPNGVILGVPHTWTDKNGILGSKRDLIKNICRELELQPLGFVVITDSILSYLKIQEGTPATAIVIQVSREELTLLLVRLGRIEAIETIGRSDDVTDDVTEGIARFKANDNLPSRIILFNSMHNLDEMMQNLLSVDWQAKFNFLHIPKIETVAKDITIRALAVAGGGEVAKSLGFAVSEPISSPTPLEPGSDSNLISAEEVGFTSVSAGDNPSVPPDDPIVVSAPRAPFTLPKVRLPKLSIPRLNINFLRSQKQLWILGGVLLAFTFTIVWLIWTVPKAQIQAIITPKILEQSVELTLSPIATGVDTTNSIIPAELVAMSESGDKTIETTGKKIVGDAARGNVTIYNRTSSTKTFNKGTSLAAGSLKFTLDSDVTVASKSAGSDYVDVPGKATVGITSTAIGAESNLPSGTEFTIMSFGKDSYVGKNDVVLGGGNSEEIRVVSKEDQKDLAQALTDELIKKLETTASTTNIDGASVYLIASSAKVSTESYSAKVGDKATTLTGNITLSASLLRYETQDVTLLINSLIDQSVPPGYMRSNVPTTVDLSADTVSDTVKGTAKVKVALLPIVDTSKITSTLTGKGESAISTILQNQIPGLETISVSVSPQWLPPRFKRLPYNPKNITLILVPSVL